MIDDEGMPEQPSEGEQLRAMLATAEDSVEFLRLASALAAEDGLGVIELLSDLRERNRLQGTLLSGALVLVHYLAQSDSVVESAGSLSGWLTRAALAQMDATDEIRSLLDGLPG